VEPGLREGLEEAVLAHGAGDAPRPELGVPLHLLGHIDPACLKAHPVQLRPQYCTNLFHTLLVQAAAVDINQLLEQINRTFGVALTPGDDGRLIGIKCR